MSGIWTAITSICSSRRTVAFAYCSSWADEGSSHCSQWADQGHSACRQWADNGSSACSRWADQGHNECCDWWPCSWVCDAFYWVANWVCQGWYWVANWVCQAWYWVVNWVCQAWYWIAKWVCISWQWSFYLFCSSANGGPMFLLTDGTVLMNECDSGYGSRRWWKLTPDTRGSYISGLWTRMADSNYGRKYFASAVLADGRLLVCGGEYSDVSGGNRQDDTAKCEIYDPTTNQWTEISPPPGVTQIGDSACCLLPNGRFLLGSFNSNATFIFDPATDTWVSSAAKRDSASEETWVLMADGTVVTPQCSNIPNAEKFVTGINRWVPAGTLAANLVERASIEIGPGLLLTDGRGFFVGANAGNTGLYTPGKKPTDVGTWTAGPSIPLAANGQSLGSKDGPGALLPSGAVLFPAAPLDGSQGNYLAPCSFFEFDGTNLSRTSDPPNANCPTYVGRLMLIPTGQVLWVREDDSAIYAYTETGQPQDSFRPVVTAVPSVFSPASTVSVSGTQFNGLSQAVAYGDDYAAATNYPLVRIRNTRSGQVRYCHTFGHTISNDSISTPSMGVATGGKIVTTQAAIPGNIDVGESELVVVANGIASEAVRVSLRRR